MGLLPRLRKRANPGPEREPGPDAMERVATLAESVVDAADQLRQLARQVRTVLDQEAPHG